MRLVVDPWVNNAGNARQKISVKAPTFQYNIYYKYRRRQAGYHNVFGLDRTLWDLV